MKNFIKVLLLTIGLVIVSVPVFGADVLTTKNGFGLYDPVTANTALIPEISVQLNGEFIDFTDSEGNKVEPQIINDRTMVPMRKIFEVLGANVEWNAEDKSIIATKENAIINLQIGNKNASLAKSGEEAQIIVLDSEPVIIENRTMVPVRFIAESLDKIVGWDSSNRTVVIIDTNVIKEKIKNDAPTFYEYMTLELEELETMSLSTKITGKLKYTDKENRKNSSTLNVEGDVNTKILKKAIEANVNLKISGSGILIDTIKEEKLTKITADIILDKENGTIYFASNLLGKDAEGKYIKYNFAEYGTNLLGTTYNLENLLSSIINEEELTINSYDTIMEIVNLITKLMSDDNLKLSGRNTKTYELKINVLELLKDLNLSDEIKDFANFYITSRIKISDKLIKEKNTELNFEIKAEDEILTVNIESKNVLKEYNKKVNIEIPTEEDILPEV